MKDQLKRSFFVKIFMGVISIFSIVNIGLITFHSGDESFINLLNTIDNYICFIFLFDFFVKLKNAKSKRQYLKLGWIDFLSSIPNIEFLRFARAFRIIKFFRLFRVIRSFREIKDIFQDDIAKSALLTASTLTFMAVYIGSVAFHMIEFGVNQNIKSPLDSLWWTIVTISTVGYGDITPVTQSGKFVAILLMIYGIGIFGVLSGVFASIFLTKDNDTLTLEKEIQELKDEIISLKEVIKDSSKNSKETREDNKKAA